MRNLVITVLAVLMAVGVMVSNVEADSSSAVLTVYDLVGGKTVTNSSASLAGSSVKAGILADRGVEITVFANLPSNLAVRLSNSQIDWTINSAGDYHALVTQIDLTTNVNSDVTMTVAEAGDLTIITKEGNKDSGQKLETYYAVKTDTGMPGSTDYTAAAAFNGTKTIRVSNSKGTAYLWNRINAVSGKPAGKYADRFTVTFSQTL